MRLGPVAAGLAVLLAGCASPPPERVPGAPAPVTVAPSGRTPAAPATSAPTRPPASPTPARVPQLPERFEDFTVTGYGVTIRLPVPSGWERRPPRKGVEGADFVDRMDLQLLRLEIFRRDSELAARQRVEAYEATRPVPDYQRLDLVDVRDVGETAVDWTFTFQEEGSPRQQVADRVIVLGSAAIAVYYRTRQGDFARLVPIWRHAVDGLVVDQP